MAEFLTMSLSKHSSKISVRFVLLGHNGRAQHHRTQIENCFE
jgi:hypothetical protein